MKYFIIAGEKSGDTHAANLILALKSRDTQAQFEAWGGDSMQAVGVKLHQHIRNLAFMGFDVLFKLSTIFSLFKQCKSQILRFRPDVLILVDYGGFNLKIANWAKSKGFKVVFYIAPKTWAWNESRVKKIKSGVDLLLVIFPFEEAYFKGFGINTLFVGNPIWDELSKSKIEHKQHEGIEVALLPGSRKKEVEKMAEIMRTLALKNKEINFKVAAVNELDENLYTPFKGISNIHIEFGKTYELMTNADFGIITSGTATLEAAFLALPQIVVFKTSNFSYLLAKNLIKIKYISLVNIILGRTAVPELIQQEYNLDNLQLWIEKLSDEKQRAIQLSAYHELTEKMAFKNASEQGAMAIVNLLNTK